MKRPNNEDKNKLEVDGCKRDMCYSLLSLIMFPFVFYASKPVNSLKELIDHILELREIPLHIIIFIVGAEVIKILLIFAIYPSSHLFDPLASAVTSRLSNSKLPMSRRDRDSSSSVRPGGFYLKLAELWKGAWNFILACGLCHIFMVLFGAPVLMDLLLTLQFSTILVSWTFFPLCLGLRPSFLLSELSCISIWNTQINSIHRAKWRFILTIFGAIVGAVFIPLDWDRPWQKWPITCLISSAVSYLVLNSLYLIYLFCILYCNDIKFTLFNRNSSASKMKFI